MGLPLLKDFSLLQNRWKSLIDPALSNPLVNGHAINGISLVANTPLQIPTKLDRMQLGWFPIDIQTIGGAWLFGVSSANATVGAVYTNNSVSFTVVNTISSGTLLLATGKSAPQTSGTLTKSSGTGDSTITFSSALSIEQAGNVWRTQPFSSNTLTLESSADVTINIWVF